MKRFGIISIFLLFVNFFTFSAEETVASSDVQFRVSGEIAKKVTRSLTLSLEEELRLKDNFSSFDRLYSTLQASYSFNPWLKAGASYSYLVISKEKYDQSYLDFRHRVSLDIEPSYIMGQFEFSLRERLQGTYRTDSVNTEEKPNPALVLRSRLKLEYSFWSVPLKPYVAVEMFNPLNNPDCLKDESGAWLENMRYSAGFTYRFDARNWVEFYYMFEHATGKDVNIKSTETIIKTEIQDNHIFGLSYKYKF